MFPPAPVHQNYAEQAEALHLLCGEVELGGELLEATRRLKDIAIECDAVNTRFEQAAADVKRLLEQRMAA